MANLRGIAKTVVSKSNCFRSHSLGSLKASLAEIVSDIVEPARVDWVRICFIVCIK